MRIGIIGRGYFGTKIYEVVKDSHEIVFFTGRDMMVSYDVDWVIIASSTPSHGELVKTFLFKGINVFCEKPLTLNFSESLILMELADRLGVKLYIDDVFLFNSEYIRRKDEFRDSNSLVFSWYKFGSFGDNIVNNLVYHDIYLLLDILGPQRISNFSTVQNRINEKQYDFVFGNVPVYLSYDRLSQGAARKTITSLDFASSTSSEIKLSSPENNPLSDMMERVLNGGVDFKQNTERHREVERILQCHFKNNKPRVAIVGAGVFGVSAAMELKDDFAPTIFESEMDILTKASSINQYRIHRGYHYPRSADTAFASKSGNDSFQKTFNCKSNLEVKSYYCIAKDGSRTSVGDYVSFLEKTGLEFEVTDNDRLKSENLGIILKVDEKLFDPKKLKTDVWKKIEEHGLSVILGRRFERTMVDEYDYVVNCSYANINHILSDNERFDCQFELCEKPVVKLPDSYKNMSVVIMDGPFMCIDPFGSTGYHVMGNVVHAIHATNVGKFPEIPKKYAPHMNIGVVPADKLKDVTNVDRFVKSASVFFKDMGAIEHIGSMFTVRTVLPERDHDDARPSFIKQHNDKVYSVFSGKITSCVDCAKNLKELLLKS